MHSVTLVSVRRQVQGGVWKVGVGFVLFLSPTQSVFVVCVFVRRFITLSMCIVTGDSDMVIVDIIWDYG